MLDVLMLLLLLLQVMMAHWNWVNELRLVVLQHLLLRLLLLPLLTRMRRMRRRTTEDEVLLRLRLHLHLIPDGRYRYLYLHGHSLHRRNDVGRRRRPADGVRVRGAAPIHGVAVGGRDPTSSRMMRTMSSLGVMQHKRPGGMRMRIRMAMRRRRGG